MLLVLLVCALSKLRAKCVVCRMCVRAVCVIVRVLCVHARVHLPVCACLWVAERQARGRDREIEWSGGETESSEREARERKIVRHTGYVNQGHKDQSFLRLTATCQIVGGAIFSVSCPGGCNYHLSVLTSTRLTSCHSEFCRTIGSFCPRGSLLRECFLDSTHK